MMFTPESFLSIASCRTAFISVHSVDALAQQLYFCSREQFTGQVELQLAMNRSHQWCLYFEKGYLVWGTGGEHPVRRLYRCFSQCGSVPATQSIAIEKDECDPYSYEKLVKLLEQKIIQQKEVEAIIQKLIVELLFDLCQQWGKNNYSFKLQMCFKQTRFDPAKLAIVAIPVHRIWMDTSYSWQVWQQANLVNYSPNQAPLIWNAKELKRQVLPKTYQNLITLIDGHQTLRDLAYKSNNQLVAMTKSLIPYIHQGLIKLIDVEDLQAIMYANKRHPLSASSTSLNSAFARANAPLIACIDDHKEDGQLMNQILTQMGYRFIHIQDSMQALPILLERKPSLIFLDLVMPIVNGYEACAQIRRISQFKETPVIILTSNDGIIDRVRAKMVGSTGFLTKPIDAKKIQQALQKALSTGNPELNAS